MSTMKGQLVGSTLRGVSTFEILIASAVCMLGMAATLLMMWGSSALVTDAQVATRALTQAQIFLGRTFALKQNFSHLTSTSTIWLNERIYRHTLSVLDYTQCQKKVTSQISWNSARLQTVELSSVLTDVTRALALGGDCGAEVGYAPWVAPRKFAEASIFAGDPIAIDELNGFLYGGSTEAPYFFIVDTHVISEGGHNTAISFANGFSMPAPLVAIDAVVWRGAGEHSKQYVYVAVDATTSQMAVIDVSDPYNPVQVATRTLNNVASNGSEPGGHKLYYYDDRLYVLTRYTAGPEMHTFDVSNPIDPVELGGGVELGVTVNDFAIEERLVSGMRKRFAYMATSQLSGELKVYDVTDATRIGAATEIELARQDLAGAQNGLSVYPLGNRLYFGRASTPGGPDLYVFDSTNPLSGLPVLVAQNVDTGVSALRVVGPLIFIVTPKSKKEIQIWSIDDASISVVATYGVPRATFGGFEYAEGVLYATGQGSSSVEVLVGQ